MTGPIGSLFMDYQQPSVMGRMWKYLTNSQSEPQGSAPKSETPGVSNGHIDIEIDPVARGYLRFKHYSRTAGFTFFSSEARSNMPCLDSRIREHGNGQSPIQLRLVGAGFSASVHCSFSDNGYIATVRNVKLD